MVQRLQTWHDVIKAGKDWRDVGVAMHSQLPRFLFVVSRLQTCRPQSLLFTANGCQLSSIFTLITA